MNLKDYEYIRTDLGTLYCGDCLEIMPLLPKVDLVLTDPPYGIENKISKGGGSHTKSKIHFHQRYFEKGANWDKAISKETISLLFVISKNQIIFGGNYYDLPPCRGFIVWDKPEMRMPTMSECEFAWASFDRPAKIFRVARTAAEATEHPTQKPLLLFTQLLSKYSKQNDTVLDPFAGSGTTAVACERLNRRWICIEISEEYCAIAKKRIELERQQLKMF